ATPVPVYQVLRESEAADPLAGAAAVWRMPLVARERELGLLFERWAQVQEGLGQVGVLSGEAGIGKSRLVQALRERLAGEPHRRLEGRGSSYHQHSAFYPVIEILQRTLGLTRQDTPEMQLEKLEASLRLLHLPLPAIVPIV